MIPVVLLLAQVALDAPVPLDAELPRLGVEGRATLETLRGKDHLVVLFLNEQCGVTFYYKARLQRLVKDFTPKGFTFVAVRTGRKQFPDRPTELPETTYLKMPFLDDEKGQLMRQFEVGQSLTFAVVARDGRLRYYGGIDDSVTEAQVKKSPLRDALRAVAAGRPVAVKRFPTLGCAMLPFDNP